METLALATTTGLLRRTLIATRGARTLTVTVCSAATSVRTTMSA